MNCESLLDHAAGFLDGSLTGPDRDAVAGHVDACADCRDLLASLSAAEDPGLAGAILAKTSGTACDRARSLMCDRVDGAIGALDAELVDGHVRHCPVCGALASTLAQLKEDLPRLAAVDPGPGFVDAVLARTSRRPRRVPSFERWAAAASRLLERPRIALEGAFVAAALVAGFPLVDARGAIGEVEATVHIEACSAFATAQAFVVESSIRLKKGTFAPLVASGEKEKETTR
jgi:Putative zinc-finger